MKMAVAGLGLFEPDPWPDPVDGADMLDQIVGGIRRHVVLPAHGAEVAALWAVHTHAPEYWRHTPRLNVTAPEKGCGKSTLLDVLYRLVPRAIKTENLSTAVLFRAVDKYRPTLLVDEVDTFLRDNEELRGCLNAGRAQGGRHLRCVGDNHEIKAFKTFAPAALAGIGIQDTAGGFRNADLIVKFHETEYVYVDDKSTAHYLCTLADGSTIETPVDELQDFICPPELVPAAPGYFLWFWDDDIARNPTCELERIGGVVAWQVSGWWKPRPISDIGGCQPFNTIVERPDHSFFALVGDEIGDLDAARRYAREKAVAYGTLARAKEYAAAQQAKKESVCATAGTK